MKTFPGCALLVVALLPSTALAAAQEKKPETPARVSMPGPATPTVPGDAMFALGQQSIQLQAISSRLEKMEPDIAQTRRDVDKLLLMYNVVVYSIGAIFTVVASYIVLRMVKKFWPEPPPPPLAVS